MNRSTRWLLALSVLGALSLAASAMAATPVTRTLQKSINVPAGGSIKLENLVGHMRVVTGTGPVQIDATVVAGGDQAQALAESVKLDVSTSGTQTLVHVDYPVDRHDTFLYNPPDSTSGGSDEVCILGKLICFHGRSSSDFRYQGKRVRVNQTSGGGSGTPLYVDVVVHLPANVAGNFSNAAGLLDAEGLANKLGLDTEGGDIHGQNLQGQLDVGSDGGDVYLKNVASSQARVHTGGGDFTGSTLSGDLNVATGGGDARLSGALSALRSLDVETGGGDFNATGDLAALTSLDIESGGGDIGMHVSGLSMHLDAASDGGDIGIHLPDMRNVNSSSGHFSCDLGKAVGTGTLRSGGGDITLTKP
ncbi:MAG: hypothetical protein EPN36_02395 [Rhodanobacteraceae bacterium]|nr:MAG: hypothetical protein EPN36_02395 [Rhodanobacteraceae bacterium]